MADMVSYCLICGYIDPAFFDICPNCGSGMEQLPEDEARRIEEGWASLKEEDFEEFIEEEPIPAEYKGWARR